MQLHNHKDIKNTNNIIKTKKNIKAISNNSNNKAITKYSDYSPKKLKQ